MEVKSYTKFIHVNYLGKVSFTMDETEGLTLEEFVDRFKEFCLGVGYSPSLVERIEIKEKEEV